MGCAHRNQGGWQVREMGGGKVICLTHRETGKIGAVNATAWRFGPEDLVKTELIIKACKKRMSRAFSIFLKIKNHSTNNRVTAPEPSAKITKLHFAK